jgi:hypothetical protein
MQSLCFTVAEEFSPSRICTKQMGLAYSYALHHMIPGKAYAQVQLSKLWKRDTV